MTIEQEFFKAFEIEPKCLNEEYSGCKYANDDNRKCCKQYKDKTCNYSYFWIYPPITPEIVLKLEEILSRCGGIDYYESFNFLGDERCGYRYYKNNRNYRLNIKEATADKRTDALCKILIMFKDEIQSKVRELFNAM